MSLTIKTNTSSLIAQNSLKTSTNKLNQAIERMSSGAKINHAKDNAANYSIATNMTTKINAYQVAEDNCAMGLDLVQTASSSLEQMSDLTSRLRALATQAQNGTYGSRSIDAINSEAQALVQELNRIKNTTKYNGINLLASSATVDNTNALAHQTGVSDFIEAVTHSDTSVMTSFASVDETVALTSGTYSISTTEELAKLATMQNNGLIGRVKFVLANDIDLSDYSTGEGWTPIGTSTNSFTGTFDGNGYVISNLYINRPGESGEGLFGQTFTGAVIKNVGLENVNVTGYNIVGGLLGDSYSQTTIENCYVTGSVVAKNNYAGGIVGLSNNLTIKDSYAVCNSTAVGYVGGLAGNAHTTVITNSYTKGNVTGNVYVGGLVGYRGTGSIENSYTTSSVSGDNYVGGLVGKAGTGSIGNSYATGSVTGNQNTGGLIGDGEGSVLNNAYYLDTTGQNIGIGYGTPSSGTATIVTMADLDELIAPGTLPKYQGYVESNNFRLQVGVNSNSASQIKLNIAHIYIAALNGLDMSSTSALAAIDEVLAAINEQQTNLGAVENRLMSALDQISVAYENLVSSRSTIQDADIGEVSSEYIREQILQEASATLMATANQSPSIALQLI